MEKTISMQLEEVFLESLAGYGIPARSRTTGQPNASAECCMMQDNTHRTGLLMGKGNATVVSTSDWKENAFLVEDPPHTTLATDQTQSSLLIKQFFRCFMLMVNSCGRKAWCYLGYTIC
jgi:hypothetical protein